MKFFFVVVIVVGGLYGIRVSRFLISPAYARVKHPPFSEFEEENKNLLPLQSAAVNKTNYEYIIIIL
jgi:hypothetical protein